MINYDTGDWGVSFVFQVSGSVLKRSLAWGIPSAICAVLLNLYCPNAFDIEGVDDIWSGYQSVLGFLVVFRNNQAYSRFWEGAALVQQVRGEWLNAVSSLVAFCNQDPAKVKDVMRFQHLLVRLMSMLHCAALQQIAEVKDDKFEIILPDGIEKSRLRFLSSSDERRCEILLQWIQRLIVEAEQAKTLLIAPPILSRVYQELSRGIVNLHNVRRIKDIPFPFPYAQVITLMMMIHVAITPVLASQTANSAAWAGVMTLLVITVFWSLLYIALELEQPFGEDMNDLPVAEMQIEMNEILQLLLMAEVQTPPKYTLDKQLSKKSNLIFKRSSTEIMAPKSSGPEAPTDSKNNSRSLPARMSAAGRVSMRGSFKDLHCASQSMDALTDGLDDSEDGDGSENLQGINKDGGAAVARNGSAPRQELGRNGLEHARLAGVDFSPMTMSGTLAGTLAGPPALSDETACATSSLATSCEASVSAVSMFPSHVHRLPSDGSAPGALARRDTPFLADPPSSPANRTANPPDGALNQHSPQTPRPCGADSGTEMAHHGSRRGSRTPPLPLESPREETRSETSDVGPYSSMTRVSSSAGPGGRTAERQGVAAMPCTARPLVMTSTMQSASDRIAFASSAVRGHHL